MRCLIAIGLAAAMLASPVHPAAAHSPGEVERALGERERYFQPIGRVAPAFTLEDAAGREIGLADLRGQVVVLHFVYASCTDVCPLHAERIAEVQEMVNRTPMKELVQFVTITTDPAKDTAEVLRDYGPAHGLDPANWVFLTTLPDQPEDATRNLARAFGHSFTPTADGMQLHGIVTHVIDQEGVWRANFHGLRFEPTSLVVYLNALTNEAQAPHPHGGSGIWERLRALFGV
jgi:protein SCO1/2